MRPALRGAQLRLEGTDDLANRHHKIEWFWLKIDPAGRKP